MNSVRMAVLGAVMTVAAAGDGERTGHAHDEAGETRFAAGSARARDGQEGSAARHARDQRRTSATFDRTSTRASTVKPARPARPQVGSDGPAPGLARRHEGQARHPARPPPASRLDPLTIERASSRAKRGICTIRRLGSSFRPAAQHLRHAPRLRDAAAGRVRRFGVEDFGDRADAERGERVEQPCEERARAGAIVADAP